MSNNTCNACSCDALAAQLCLTAYLGEDRVFTGTHQVSEDDATPVDLTGWTIVVTIKNAALTTVTIAGSVVLGPAGTFAWLLSAANTVTLGAGMARLDVWRTDSGSATLMALGDLAILQEVRV